MISIKPFGDYTELKNAIEGNSEHFRLAFQAIPDAAILIDPQEYPDVSWPIVDCNVAASKMNGYSREEMISKSIDLLHINREFTQDREEYLRILREKAREESFYEIDAIHRTKDGVFIEVQCHTSLIKIGERELVIGIDRDITELKRMSRLRETTEKIARASLLSDFDHTLQAITEDTRSMLACDVVAIYSYDEETGNWCYPAAYSGVQYPEAVDACEIIPKHSIIYEMLKQPAVYIVPDVAEDQLFKNRRFPKNESIQSVIAIPLRVRGDQRVGVMFANYRAKHTFTTGELANYQLFADQAAIVIFNAQLYGRVQRQHTLAEALAETATELNRSRNLATVLERILENLSRFVSFDSANIMLLDETTREIYIARSRGYNEVLKTELEQFRRSVADVPILSQMIADKKHVIIPETQGRTEWKEYLISPHIRSYLGVPLIVEDRVIGFLNINSLVPNAFPDEPIRALKTFANQAAVAVSNAKRNQLIDHEAYILQTLMDNTPDCICFKNRDLRIHRANRAFVEFVNKNRSEDVLGKTDADLFPADIAGQFSEDDRRVIDSDATSISKEIELAESNSEQNRWIVQHRISLEDHVHHSADKLICISRDISPLVNAMQTVNTVAEIVNQKLADQEVLQTIVDQVLRVLNCDHCTLFLRESDAEGRVWLKPKVTSGSRTDPKTTREFLVDEDVGNKKSLAVAVFLDGRSRIVPDVTQDEYYVPPRTGSLAEDRNAMLLAPIMIGSQTVGVISADHHEISRFNQADRRLLEALAQQAGIAIERAHTLRLLLDVGQRIVSRENLSHTLQEIVCGATELTNTDTGVIYLFGTDAKTIIDQEHYPPSYEHPGPRMDKENGLTRTIIRERRPLIIPNIKADERVNNELYPLYKSMIGVPLMSGERVIGVLFLHKRDYHEFSEAEVARLSILLDLTVVAIRNARLVEQARKLYEFSNRIGAVQDRNLVAGVILDGLKGLVDYHKATVQLIEGNSRELLTQRGIPPGGISIDLLGSIEKDELIRYIIKHKQIIIIPDTSKPKSKAAKLWKPKPETQDVKSWIGIPLIYQGYVIGLITLDHKSPNAYTGELHDLLSLFANQAASALENALLFEDRTDLACLGMIGSMFEHMIYTGIVKIDNALVNTQDMVQEQCGDGIAEEGFRDVSTRIERILEQIYELSLHETSQPSPEPIYIKSWLINEANKAFPASKYSLLLQVNIDPEVAVWANETLLSGGLRNLLQNASEAMDKARTKEITISARRWRKYVIIRIQDTGSGIPVDIRNLVFKRRIRHKVGAQGMGMGMLMAGIIIRQFDGEVQVINNGPGTTVEIRLPVYQD